MVNETLNKLDRAVYFDTNAKRTAMAFVGRMSALPGLFVPKIRSYERDVQVNLVFELGWRRLVFFVHETTGVFCRQEWHQKEFGEPLVDDRGELRLAFSRDAERVDTEARLTELWKWLKEE